MFIPNISLNINRKYNTKNNQINFKAHPDFERLSKSFDIKASSFFRRGPFYGSPDEQFSDIISVFAKMFGENMGHSKKMLIAGIGDSQEPFSYLAVIKNLIKDIPIAKSLDLNIVDLQSKPSKRDLFINSYYESRYEPAFVASSFVKDVRDNILYGVARGYYRINDDIFNFLDSVYKNKSKSLWETQIQEAIKHYKSKDFDIVSINNTLGYIEDRNAVDNTVKEVYRVLKKNGVFITDPHYDYLERTELIDKFEKLNEGIYKKNR